MKPGTFAGPVMKERRNRKSPGSGGVINRINLSQTKRLV